MCQFPRRFAFAPLLLLVALAAAGPMAMASVPQRAKGPLKVYILAGQSNMQGHAEVRTLPVMVNDPKSKALHARLVDDEGTPRTFDDVRISCLGCADSELLGPLTTGFGAAGRGPKIGPELAFGATMHERLGEPILIIKTAWGGKSLHTDFRPPSAGPYEFNASQVERMTKQGKDIEAERAARAKVTGHYYREMVQHVQSVLKDVKRVHPAYSESRGIELSGFVWFQGWNDMVDSGVYPDRGKPGGYGAYAEVMAHFIRDVRRDLKAPDLPFIIGVLGVGGPVSKYGPDQKRYAGIHQNFRDAMAAPANLPEFQDNVAAVLTENHWDLQLTALRKRDRALNPERKKIDERRKAGTITAAEAKAAKERLRAEEFTENELAELTQGVSNQEYHYLGSAKILSGIGEAFAEAVLEMAER